MIRAGPRPDRAQGFPLFTPAHKKGDPRLLLGTAKLKQMLEYPSHNRVAVQSCSLLKKLSASVTENKQNLRWCDAESLGFIRRHRVRDGVALGAEGEWDFPSLPLVEECAITILHP